MHKQNNVAIKPGLEGFVARPAGTGPFPGVVVLMEAYGITGHIQGVCTRLAKAGFVALAPDLFHGEIVPYNDMQAAIAKIGTLKDEVMVSEVAASLDWLASNGTRADRNGVIGFCMGGRLAFLSGCRLPERLQAVVSFYGGAIAPDDDLAKPDRFGRTPPLGQAGNLKAPLFLGYGADDQGIGPAEHARIVSRLTGGKQRYVLSVYPGAGHAFLCEERPAYAPAVVDGAWRDAIDFLSINLD